MDGCMSKRGCSNQTMKNCSCTSYSSTKRYSAVHNICTVHREIPSIDLDAIAAMTRDALSIYGAELQHHDPPAQGHPGYKAMLRNMQENYFWFDMAAHCKLLKVMHSLSGVLAQTVARDLLCKDSLIIASSTPQVSHFYIARAYPIIQSTSLIPPFDTSNTP